MKTAAVCLSALLVAAHAAALEPDVLFGKVSSSVWGVRTFDAQGKPLRVGSAVVIAPGRLVTTCHVLAKASSFVVQQENVSYGATLEYPDPPRDLCQIKVANFSAPPVTLAPAASARVGQRVYAIGNPRGLENTLSEGMLSGLRGGNSEERHFQTTAAIAPGSSGGGLFDSEGRLLGITTFGDREGGSLNFAVPVEFLAELPARAKAMLEARRNEPAGNARRTGGAADGALTAPLRPGDALEYVRIDGLTGNRSTVIYRVDRINGDEITFNAGGRIEKTNGQLVSAASPAGGLFDSSSPPGGWGRRELEPGMRWRLEYLATTDEKARHELDAVVSGRATVRVDGEDLPVMRIDYDGWIYAGGGIGSAASMLPIAFKGTAMYSPDLGRVVQFDAEFGRRSALTRESLQLVRVVR